MAADVRRAKEALRATMLAARATLSPAELAAAGEQIAVIGMDRWRGAGTIAAYLSIGAEPPTQRLIDGLVAAGTRVLLPVIDDDGLDWARYSGPGDVAAGPLGINEPVGARLGPAALRDADVVLVPALAVDRHGHRLGRGRGYYDRALAASTVPLIAVVHDAELVDRVPVEPHDRRVDGILRPSGFTRPI